MKPEWTDFIVCLLTGWLGIHRFREGRAGLGVIYLFTLGLFGIGWIVDTVRYLMAAIKGERIPRKVKADNSKLLPSQPKRLNPNDPLPIAKTNIILKDGELCHYSAPVVLAKTKNVVVGYQGGSRGASI